MATTGTYNFNPGAGELGLYAFNMLGVRRPDINDQHLADLRIAANLVISEWANRQPDLWDISQTSVSLTQGTATYSVPANVVMILDAHIETVQGTTPTDRVVTAISRSEYSSYPNKQDQGPPTVYWFDRILAPTFTLWPVPDGNGPYAFNYYYVSRGQDVSLTGGATVDVPFGWLRAFAAALAAELAPAYAPEREAVRRADAERSFLLAAAFNVEQVPFTIAPNLSGYFRK
jgi:hypothetical protein